MVVAVECLDVCVVVGGVPQLDGEVGGACRHEAAARIKVDVDDGLCVALEGALHLAALPVPELDGGVLAGGTQVQ